MSASKGWYKFDDLPEWISHHHGPNIQYPINSLARENGIITRPRKKSATASDAMNQFWMFFNDFSVMIAMITNIFPTTMTIIKSVTTIDANTIWGKLYPLGYVSWIMVEFGFVSFVKVKWRLNDEFPTVARNSSVVLSEINAMLIYDAFRFVFCFRLVCFGMVLFYLVWLTFCSYTPIISWFTMLCATLFISCYSATQLNAFWLLVLICFSKFFFSSFPSGLLFCYLAKRLLRWKRLFLILSFIFLADA